VALLKSFSTVDAGLFTHEVSFRCTV
jgi:hypothetical protein